MKYILTNLRHLTRTMLLLSLGAALGLGSMSLYAVGVNTSGMFSAMDPGLELPNKATELMHARADHWRLVGKTIIVRGNVYIPYGNLIIRADEAVLDTESRDLEAKGHISFMTVKKKTVSIDIDNLNKLQNVPDCYAEVTGTTVDPLGNRAFSVTVYSPGGILTCDRLSGNLATGLLHFTKLRTKMGNFIGKAERGVRQPGGELHLEDLEISYCSYLAEEQSHYSVSLATANLYPHETEGFGFSNTEDDQGEYSIWGYNGAMRVYGLPVMWLPMFYKPKDESPGLFQFQLGKSNKWGYYALFAKKFRIFDVPCADLVLDVDYYSLRGVGAGARTYVNTDNSKTAIRAYGIYDLRPYESSGDRPEQKDGSARMDIPHMRYEFQITNTTHLTPRLDFRAQLEFMSDAYMLDDFMGGVASGLSEPATYAALEYQADRFSASIYTRVQINRFYTTMQKLPELRLDVPRQEVIPGWGLYYQGSHTADYLTMNWAHFDRKLINPESELKDYRSGRFDSVNFLYYPLRTNFINIVPRAGIRLTGYTASSKKGIDENGVYLMQVAGNWKKDFGRPVTNYDRDGGSKFRFIAEFGVEANTKIYRSWQDVRNAFWELDGLRHVCEPYINYTYVTKPTEDRDHLYFFDDIDRITEQNFIRLGVRNRLQTRSGGFRSGSMREWFSMENYWDIYFKDDDDYNHIGDLCTKLTFSPTSKFTISTAFSIDAGRNQKHDTEAMRNGRTAGRPGISGNILNRANLTLSYMPIPDMKFNFSYDYRDGYIGRAAYSMGSTLTEIESGSVFDQYYALGRSQTLSFGVITPLTPDRKTQGSYTIGYDFEQGGFTSQKFSVSRLFHCIRVSAVFSLDRVRDREEGNVVESSYSINVTLVGMEGPMNAVRRSNVVQMTGIDR